MTDYRADFLKICIDNEILRFGEFTLKSGRVSPYFFNAGLFNNGKLLHHLATAYAHLMVEKLQEPYMLYGPAYKGIPLAAATAMQLAIGHNLSVPYAFNRKEVKDHGEGGLIVGAELQGNVVIVDDVITAGTSVNESIEIITKSNARVSAIVIALDRQEIADGDSLSAVDKIKNQFDIPIHALLKLDDLVTYLASASELNTYHPAVIEYRKRYGYKTSG